MWILANTKESLNGIYAAVSGDMEDCLIQAGMSSSVLDHVKRIKGLFDHKFAASSSRHQRRSSDSAATASSGGLLSAVGSMIKGEQQKKGERPLAVRTFEAMMNSHSFKEENAFIYLDPKHKGPEASAPRKSSTFREGIFFVIGGGSYAEHEELCKFASGDLVKRHIVYGSTEMFTPETFLKALSHLKKK